jgi:hypothetical protein
MCRVAQVRDGRVIDVTTIGMHDQLWHDMPEISHDGMRFQKFEPQGLELVHMETSGMAPPMKEQSATSAVENWPSAESAWGEPRSAGGERSFPWTQYGELDKGAGTVEFFAKPDPLSVSGGVPPIRCVLRRPDRPFARETGMTTLHHEIIALLDSSDGTLWRVQLYPETARLEAVHTPNDDPILGVDRFVKLGGLAFGAAEFAEGEIFCGKAGTYVLDGGELRTLRSDTDMADKKLVRSSEAGSLVRYAVSDSWLDAFTQEVRVERLADQRTVFKLTSEPRTADARTAARIYTALTFLRAPAGVAAERFLGWTSMTWSALDADARQQRLFRDGRHMLLFVFVMLAGLAQVLLAWRWLARSGAGIATRVVFALFVLVGGVAALIFTRLLLPRRAYVERQPAPANAQRTLAVGV